MKRRNFLMSGSIAALFPWLPRAMGAEAPQAAATSREAPAALAPAQHRREGTPQSPITNRWGIARYTKLDLEETCIFRGREGAAYNHHPQMLFDQGRLYASWSNGIIHEDQPGQRMLFAVSEDDGKTWSKESQITPPPIEKTSTYTAEGIRSHDGKLIAYYGHYGYADRALYWNGLPNGACIRDYRGSADEWAHKDTFAAVRMSDDGGRTWGEPIRNIEKFVPNLRPFPTRSGRLIVPGNITYPYTDDPAGIEGWTRAGLPRLPNWVVDDPEGFHKGCFFRHDIRNYCEASFFQTDDGVLHMMQRLDRIAPYPSDGLLGVTESADNGETWSEPMLTSYTDCGCRFQFGRLPDGRFFGLTCPNPRSDRTPLVLATSRDGVVFDQHYEVGGIPGMTPHIPGHYRNGVYGYSSCDIANGKMYIIYSRNKEDIYFSRLDLSALA